MRKQKQKSAPKAIIPVWAQRISVDIREGNLVTTGWGHIGSPVDTRRIDPGRVSQLDILERFRRYSLRNLGKDQSTGDAGVYQFADATDDEKLIAFCQEFGPIFGEVTSRRLEDDETETLVVSQSMERLREAQRKYAAAVRLLQQLNRNGQVDSSELLRAMRDTQMHSAFILSLFQEYEGNGLFAELPERERKEELISFAHLTLCEILNETPPRLAPVGGTVIELPITRDQGIRDALYYRLRLDYLAQRQIGTCLHCNSHFPVYKRGTQGCSESCRRALRNQRYWNKSKSIINAERREKHT